MSDDLARFSTLFGAFGEDDRKRLTAASKKEPFQPGQVLCREGEEGADLFVLVKGRVTVSGDDFGTARELATLEPGEFFGELSAIAGKTRQATVTALEAGELLRIPLAALNEALKTSPRAREVLQKAGLRRMENTLKKMME